METFKAIEKRRSNNKFNDLPVEWEKIGNILRAAQLAPSSGNVQDFRFVVVTDKIKRAAIANAALKQHWIATAPVIIVVYSDPSATKRFYGLRGEKLYAIQNSAAAIENILLAATSQELASCWVGAFDETMLNDVNLVDIVYLNSWRGKIVNIDLVFDDFSDVIKNKIYEAKEAIETKAPTMGTKLVEKSKEHFDKINKRIKDNIESRKKRKEKQLEKEIDSEEDVLDDSEDFE